MSDAGDAGKNVSQVTPGDLTAVVLAGGRGTRIASLYPDLPKPLIPACGEPFLHWVSAWLGTQGVRDIVYSTGYRGEQIEEWVAGLDPAPGLRLRCRREATALGTGGGILNCLDLCSDNVLALNGDSMLVADIAPMLNLLSEGQADGVLMGLEVSEAGRFGSMVVDEAGKLCEFSEKRPGPGIINGGVYLMRRRLFEGFPHDVPVSMEYDILPGLLARGEKLAVHVIKDASFIDIGTPESVVLAEDFIVQNRSYFAFPFAALRNA